MLFRKPTLLALAALPISFGQVSNDFEGGWDQTVWPIYAPDCNSGGTVALDATNAYSGSNSMKVTSPGGYCGHIFFDTTAVPGGDVYVRVRLKAITALTANHVTFITMPDAAKGTNKHLRIGGQDEILMYNREVDNATLAEMSPQGVATSEALPVDAWECLEYHLGTNGSIETWLNSNAIAGLFTTNNANDNGWKNSAIIPTITGVYFGWESYGGDTNTFWYDDIAVAPSRFGCAVSGVSSVSASATTASQTATTLVTSSTAAGTSAVATVPLYGQCGGNGLTGGTVCISGTCTANGVFYSQGIA